MVAPREMTEDDLSRADVNDQLSMHSIFNRNHQPPMNEQRATDEPILALAPQVSLSYHEL